MDYVCHKVGLLFPLCEACKSYNDCAKEAKPSKTHPDIIQLTQTPVEAD
jgi:hypothetical protein